MKTHIFVLLALAFQSSVAIAQVQATSVKAFLIQDCDSQGNPAGLSPGPTAPLTYPTLLWGHDESRAGGKSFYVEELRLGDGAVLAIEGTQLGIELRSGARVALGAITRALDAPTCGQVGVFEVALAQPSALEFTRVGFRAVSGCIPCYNFDGCGGRWSARFHGSYELKDTVSGQTIQLTDYESGFSSYFPSFLSCESSRAHGRPGTPRIPF